MWATQVVAAGALAGTIVLASCGNSGNGATVDDPVPTEDTEPAGDGAAPTVRPCLVLPLEQVEALVDAPVTAGPDPHNSGNGCEWTAEVVGDGDARESRLVDLQVHDVASDLEGVLTLDGQPAQVEGPGDQTLLETSTDGPPAVMVAYRDADRVVSLRYEVQALGATTVDPREDPDPVVAALSEVATAIAELAG